MTPAEREEIVGLRKLIEYALHRVDQLLEAAAPVSDLAKGGTSAAIVSLLQGERRAIGPKEITERLQAAGRDVSEAAVYQACHRLKVAGMLSCGRGKYQAP